MALDPKKVKVLKTFLGACGFFRRHIDGFSRIVTHLTCLTNKDTLFAWVSEQEDSFRLLKEAS